MPRKLDDLRRRLLEAREARAAVVARALGSPGGTRSGGCVFLSLNVPGPDKDLPGLDAVFERAREAALSALPGSRVLEDGRDALGPWAIAACGLEPADAKRRCVSLEETLPCGRLVDLDVYSPTGEQVDRRALGLPARRCLACADAAATCIRLQRHDPGELRHALNRLLESAL